MESIIPKSDNYDCKYTNEYDLHQQAWNDIINQQYKLIVLKESWQCNECTIIINTHICPLCKCKKH